MNAQFEPRTELVPMAQRDLDEVLAIEYGAYEFPWGRGNFSDSMASGYSCWVCRVGGELVAYFVLMLVVDEAHLLNLCVAKKRQRMGYGARLLRHAIAVARRGGAQSLLLEVRPSNAQALQLYSSFGFKEIGRRRGYYPAAIGREDAIVLRHALDEVSTWA
jgi:ribosomal-protein-alanine N-acetyltransferase